MNSTLVKFGYPQSCVAEFGHWAVLLRPAQVTFGALVLATKHDATQFSDLPAEAFAELKPVTTKIEAALKQFRPYDKLNFLCLMMVDPHIHFHVLPRYSAPQVFEEAVFEDAGWPALPDLKNAPQLAPATLRKIHLAMVDAFAKVV